MRKIELVGVLAGWLSLVGFCWMVVMCIFSNAVVPPHVANLGYFIFGVPWLVEMIMSGRWKYRFRKEHLLSYAMILFFALELMYLPNEGNLYLKKLMEKRYPLILFALTGLFGYSDKLTLRRVIDVMAVVSVVAVGAVAIHAGIWRLIVDSNRSAIFVESRTLLVNTHMKFNFYLNATLVGMWWIWMRCRERATWRGILYLVSVVLIVPALLITDGRNGLLTFILLALSITTYECWIRWKWRTVAIAAVLVAAMVAVAKTNPRFKELGFHNEPRVAFWKSASELIAEKPIFGYGVNNAQEEFDKVNMKYQYYHMVHFWQVENNCLYNDSHNQFIQTVLEFGIVGLLVLLSLYVLPLVVVRKERLMLMSLVIVMSVLQSMTDMFITGQFCTLFCVLIQSIIAFPLNNKSDFF